MGGQGCQADGVLFLGLVPLMIGSRGVARILFAIDRACDEAMWTDGATLVVDGGMTSDYLLGRRRNHAGTRG
jgi:hypothetical protein